MRIRSTSLALGMAALLAACVLQSSYQQQVPKTGTYQQLDAQLTSERDGDQAQIEQLQNLVRVTLSSGILFAEGGAELNEAGKTTLAKLAPALKALTGQRVVIKGFTDNLPSAPSRASASPALSTCPRPEPTPCRLVW